MENLRELGRIEDMEGGVIEFFNPHPKGKFVGDCVKRALVKGLEIEYTEVSKLLLEISRPLNAPIRERNRMLGYNYYHEYEFSHSSVWKPVLEGHGYETIPVLGFYTVAEMALKLKKYSNVIVTTNSHMVCIRDGVIYDSWDSRNRIIEAVYVKAYWVGILYC